MKAHVPRPPAGSEGRKRIAHRLGYRKTGFCATKTNIMKRKREQQPGEKACINHDRKSISNTDKALIPI